MVLSAPMKAPEALPSSPSISGRDSFFFLRPLPSSFSLPRRPPVRLSLSLTFARRRNQSSSVSSSSSSSKKKKRNLFPKEARNEEEDVDEDALELLFSQLEKDLKNDELSMDDDDGEEDEFSEEDLAKLERELGLALGIDDDEEEEEEAEGGGEEENLEDAEEEEMPIKLKNWQLRRLAMALKNGRRKTSIKNLAAELCLDRAIVLHLLREPPPSLLMLSASLPDPPKPSIPEIKTLETTDEEPIVVDTAEEVEGVKLPVHVMQQSWTAQKRLKKVQVETLERVYRRTKRPTITMRNWVVEKVLGQGSYGVVFLAKPKIEPLHYFAVKASPIEHCSSLSKEKNILNRFIGCPEIIQHLGSEITVEDDSIDDEYVTFYHLKLEYAAGGTLADLIKRRKKLSENEVKEYIKMILRGLSCIHREKLVHADLKPDNILVFPESDGTIKLKIADFGLSRNCGETDEEEDEEKDCKYIPKFKGTARYMSPESIICSEYNIALDVWSLGCVLVEMVSGKSVWGDCPNRKRLFVRLVRDREVPKVPAELSEEGKDFLKKCFDQNPNQRWTADMLLEHPYLRKENKTIAKKVGVEIRPIIKLPGLPKFPKELHLPHLQSKLRSYIQNTMI